MTFEKPDREVDRIFIHCSASDNPDHDDVEVMRKWHVEGNGWSDVGYHFFIKKDGTLQAGRPLERTPAAQGGNNTGTIAICLHGLAEERFTKAQFETLIGLCREINDAYDGMATFHGHCEVSSKSCPVFSYRKVLGLDAHGAFALAPSASPSVSDSSAAPSPGHAVSPILRLMDRGEDVRLLQVMLSRAGHPLEEDGIFGQATLTALRAFQEAKNLTVDGIAGPRTWAALRAADPA